MRTYRVGTFYYDDIVGKVLCYLRVYRPGSPGCVEFDVEATSGREAKKIARKLRLAHEATPSPTGGQDNG